MKKIIAVICELPRDKFWLPISIKSYIDWADHVVIVDGSHTDYEGTFTFLNEKFDFTKPYQLNKIEIINSPYPHDDKGADGKQRNKYLNFIKEHYEGDLAIVVDSDEVLADDAKEQIDKIIELMKEHNGDIYNPRMDHFIKSFKWVDASQDFHYCPGRIFKISKDLIYPEVEHVFLQSKENRKLKVLQPIIQPVLYYHCGYLNGVDSIIKKYENHLKKSNIHTPEFLEHWKNSHIFDTYPKKTFIGNYPKPLKDKFKI